MKVGFSKLLIALNVLLATSIGLANNAIAKDRPNYANHPLARAFVDEMVKEHGFKKAELTKLFTQAEKRDDIIRLMTRPAEGKPWHAYRKIFITDRRIREGAAFIRDHQEALEAAEKKFGVPPRIITAIIGVETSYGGNTGRHRVIDALSTLAFDYPKRAKFFRAELEHFLLLTRDEKLNPLTMKGSYAGAVGLGQFIPSSYRHYAVDGDGDGVRDLWENETDAIFSVANYFARHGWTTDGIVAIQATLSPSDATPPTSKGRKPEQALSYFTARGARPRIAVDGDPKAILKKFETGSEPEYWFGFDNFYVITRYNHSHKYAMAVYQLSEAIEARVEAGLAKH